MHTSSLHPSPEPFHGESGELKPCPWCGFSHLRHVNNSLEAFIECVHCGTCKPLPENKSEDRQRAIWNTRTPDPESAAEIERLRRENGILASGIQDVIEGSYGPKFASKHDQCPHGRFEWEVCGNCVDDKLASILSDAAALRAAGKEGK